MFVLLDLKVLVKGPHKADAERNLALSLDTSEIFWTNENMDCISRMTFSAENKTCLNVSTDQPTGIALDEENRCVKCDTITSDYMFNGLSCLYYEIGPFEILSKTHIF